MTTIIMRTSEGDITINLFDDQTPVTVKNFLGLATGEKEWTDPFTGQPSHEPFYNGLTFHRIIKDFMIQGGCPLGNGTGGPGYDFDDEIVPELTFDRPYLLAMANAGLRRGRDGKAHGTNGWPHSNRERKRSSRISISFGGLSDEIIIICFLALCRLLKVWKNSSCVDSFPIIN